MSGFDIPFFMTLACVACDARSHMDQGDSRAGWLVWTIGGEFETCIRYAALCPECAKRAKESSDNLEKVS